MNSENFQNRSLRNIFGKFATGVCAVSYYNKDDKPRGITVNSFTSVSLEPALALWCINNDSELYGEIIGKDKYIFNFLSEDQLNIAQLLSMKNNHNLNNIDFINHDFGLIFKDSIGWISCLKKEIIKSGDHSIIIGEVDNFEILNEDKKPLIFWSGDFSSKIS